MADLSGYSLGRYPFLERPGEGGMVYTHKPGFCFLRNLNLAAADGCFILEEDSIHALPTR